MTSTGAERYEIEEQIGSGGAATVYRAMDTVLQRPVALKLLNRDVDPALKEKFQSEAQAVARLNHPNIVNVYDVQERDGWPFIVMELVDGDNLKHVIQRRGPLSPEEAVGIVSQVGGALSYAHRNGLVHCDVKPHNILIRPDGRAKLVDFGIAQAKVDRRRDDGDQVLGTPLYIAPEQAVGQPVSPRTDVYGLGLVLAEALTGKAPERPHPDQPVRLDYTGLAPGMAEVVRRATAVDPAARYAGMDEMLRALQTWRASPGAQQTTVSYRPVPVRDRPSPAAARGSAPLTRKRRGGLGLLPALALLVLIVGLLVSWAVPRLVAVGRQQLDAVRGVAAGEPTVSIPRLSGMQLTDARAAAKRAGLQLLVSTEPSAGQPVGVVTKQDPPPGTPAKSGSQVRLVVAGGAAPRATAAGQTAQPTPVVKPVDGVWTAQITALRQPVSVVLNEDGRSSSFVMQPGEYREARGRSYLRIEATPASQLAVTVDGTRLGTLLQAAERVTGRTINSSNAYIDYGGSGSGDSRGQGKGKGGKDD